MDDEYLLKAQRRLIAIRERENALVNRAVLILLGCALLMTFALYACVGG